MGLSVGSTGPAVQAAQLSTALVGASMQNTKIRSAETLDLVKSAASAAPSGGRLLSVYA